MAMGKNRKLKSQPLVSVVTPVYNGEAYLAECIESVISQTYDNWVYVIVNNCSTDKSLEIAEHYRKKDSRIRIHNNTTFMNLMQNLNHAMRQISPESKYSKVVHADDWLFPECIARMVEVAEAHPSVGIVGSYRLDENKVNLDGLPYPSTIVSGIEVCRSFFLDRLFLFGSPTSLLIRSKFIRNRETFYNESNIHADLEACFDILQSADFGFVHQVLTFTRRHNESETTTTRFFKTYRIGDLIALKKFGHIYFNNEEYKRVFDSYLKWHYRILSRNVFKMKDKKFRAYHREELRKLGHPLSFVRLYTSAFIFLYNRLLHRLKL